MPMADRMILRHLEMDYLGCIDCELLGVDLQSGNFFCDRNTMKAGCNHLIALLEKPDSSADIIMDSVI